MGGVMVLCAIVFVLVAYIAPRIAVNRLSGTTYAARPLAVSIPEYTLPKWDRIVMPDIPEEFIPIAIGEEGDDSISREEVISPDIGYYVFEPYYNTALQEERIKVYQKGNAVPIQILKISMYEGSDIPFRGKMLVEDINFDGYKDVLVLREIDELENKIYEYMLFDVDLGTFSCNEMVNACSFMNPHIAAKADEMIEDEVCGDNCLNIFTYRFIDERFVRVEEQRYTYNTTEGYCLETIRIDPVTKYRSREVECSSTPL
jgi:hypothetical protein